MLLTSALALLLTASVAAAAPSARDPGRRVASSRPAEVDRDGDKVFDDLEARLAKTPAEDKLGVVVVLRAAASPERVRALQRAVGNFNASHRFSIVKGFAARMSKGQIRELARQHSVAQIEENSIVHAFNDIAQSSFGVTKARIDAPALDGDGDGTPAVYSRDDLVAAVIDTGIDRLHLDLDQGKVIAFKDFVNNRTGAYDDEGHGTHVAATAAGDGDARADKLYKGVAPAAALVGVKVLDRRGRGTDADVIEGIEWAVQNKAAFGIELLTLSLGTSGCSGGTDASSLAVDNAQSAGLVVTIAAGNEGPGTCTIGSPGAAAKALTVGAMADLGANGFHQAFFSSRGPTADGRTKPDVSAPGVDITSAQAGTINGYVAHDGTSMATPFIAGVALLMLDANRSLTPQAVKDKIMATAVDWGRGGDNKTAGSSGPDVDYGAGRLDAYAAITSAGASINTPPTVPAHELRQGSLSGSGAQVDYPLQLSDTEFPIAVTLIMSDLSVGATSSPDFDLYLFDPSGKEVAASESLTRQEELGYKPAATGTYTIRVKSFSGSGNYFLDISFPKPGIPYPRPSTATPLRVALVPAFKQCSAPNSEHVAPLKFPSCSPPNPESALLTTSVIGRGSGLARLDVVVGDPSTPQDEADVKISASATDVKNKSDGSDYAGKVILTTNLRITDKANGETQGESATVQDTEFSIPIDCSTTPSDPAIGSTCAITSTADTLVPGFAKEGKRAVIEAFTFVVEDVGANPSITPPSGSCPPTCGSGDEQVFLRQGIFAP